MTITELRSAYLRCYRLFSRLANEHRDIHHGSFDGLTQPALLRIESGETTERDVRVLLVARSRQMRRQG
ncbi:MAG: hypothetical protein RIC56_15900 [Pseudomonadales bacterium]